MHKLSITSNQSLCSSAAAVHLAFPRPKLIGMLMQGVLLKYDLWKCEMLIQITRTPETVTALRFIVVTS